MILYFLRHAQAEPMNPHGHHHDRDRLLTPDGRDLMERAAKGYIKIGVHFDRILSSPYPRAVESAKIVSDVFRFQRPIEISDNLVPDALFHKFRKEMLSHWAKHDALLIVTHQPFVSECIACLLTGKDVPLAVDMGTGTLCTLEIDFAFKGPAILSSMLKAEQAALIGVSR